MDIITYNICYKLMFILLLQIDIVITDRKQIHFREHLKSSFIHLIILYYL